RSVTMPSPCPGMDPFLEHPAMFPGLHGSLAIYLREALQARLPEPYFAEVGERLWVETSVRLIEPDVNILRSDGDRPAKEALSGSVALATPTRTQPIVITVPHDEQRGTFVEIRTRTEGNERIVAVIEVLSLGNKT